MLQLEKDFVMQLRVRDSEDLVLVLEHYMPHLKVTLGILIGET